MVKRQSNGLDADAGGDADADADAETGAPSETTDVTESDRTTEEDPGSEPDFDAIFGALAHPIRRALIEQLAGGSESVGELAEPHDVSLAAVSKHLQTLADAGLIEVEKDGRVRRCHLDAAPLSDAFGWLTRYRIFWEDRFDALEDHLQRNDNDRRQHDCEDGDRHT